MGFWHNILAVIRRELSIIRRRPIYIVGTLGVLTFCAVFCFTFFSAGLPDDLPIAVVDLDNSSLSREFARQLDATQLGKVVKYDDFTSARKDMQNGRVTSIVVIPRDMYADVQYQRQPKIEFYLNALYFVGGALAYKDILTMLNLANGAVQREVLRMKGMGEDTIMGLIQPIEVDTHQIGNVYTNYGYYLSNILIPGFLELMVIIITIYAFGTELKYGSSRHLLSTAGGSMFTVIIGKLIFFTIFFSLIGMVLVIAMYHWMHFPMAGSIWNMFLAIVLLVLASEGVGVFILGCLPTLRLALSIGALYSVLGFSFSGFTLPIEVMPDYIQGLAAGFPLRHYYLMYVQEVVFGSGFAGWWPQAVYMMIFLLLPLTVAVRLKRAYIKLNFPRE